MNSEERRIATGVLNATAVMSGPPDHWTWSSLREVETCARRYALESASYPELWSGRGYPSAPVGAALYGDVVHDSLELIVRALASAGCTSSSSPDAVVVLKSVGGYSAVLAAALDERIGRLEGNPRVTADRRDYLQRQVESQLPRARAEVQGHLARMALLPKRRLISHDLAPSSNSFGRHALSQGTYAELTLRADDERVKGRVDRVTVFPDRADIADHKTGVEHEHHAEQLRFYALLWHLDRIANPEKVPVGSLTIAYSTREVVVEPPDETEMDLLIQSTLSRVRDADGRVRQDPPEATVAAHCLHCPVRSVCTAYWSAMEDGAATNPESEWFDFEGLIGSRNGARSWWVHNSQTGARAFLLRTPSPRAAIKEGARLRLTGLHREDDPEVEAPVATLTSASEVFVLHDD